MKINLQKEELLSAVKMLNKVIDKKSPLLATKNIKFEVYDNDAIRLTATNSTYSVQSFLNGKANNVRVIEEFMVNGEGLLNSITKLSNDDIEIEYLYKENTLKLSSGKRKFSLGTMLTNDFPKFLRIDSSDETQSLKLSKKEFLSKINTVNKMVSKELTRPVLTTVHLFGNKDTNVVEIVATDSKRLAKNKIMIDYELENEINLNIPNETINFIIQALEESECEEFEFKSSKTRLELRIDDTFIYSTLIDIGYPNVARLIPSESDLTNRILIDRNYLLDVANCVMFKNGDAIMMTLEIKDSKATIKNIGKEIGKFNEELDEDLYKYRGDDFSITFDVQFLKEALKTFNGDSVFMAFHKEIMKPFIMASKDESDKGLLQLMLPIRTF